MDNEFEGAPEKGAGAARFIVRMESFYLSALRIMLLLLATVLILCAVWYGVNGLYKVSRDAASVKVEPATATANEIADISTVDASADAGKPTDPLKDERAYYKLFVDRYYGVFSQKYQPFRQADDGVVDRADFDRRFVRSGERLDALGRGELVFAQDKADLDALLTAMQEVTALPVTADRLNRYKTAKKTRVSRVVRSTRPERYCSYYGYYIGQCISYGVRNVAVERTVTDVQLPKGVLSPVNLLHAYQDRHFELIDGRRRTNANQADADRANILAGNLLGAERLWQSVLLVGGFLTVMFLFLLIAIERHQRRIAAAIPPVE